MLDVISFLLLPVLVVAASSCGGARARSTSKKVVVLGMDPQLLQRYMYEGKRGVAPGQ